MHTTVLRMVGPQLRVFIEGHRPLLLLGWSLQNSAGATQTQTSPAIFQIQVCSESSTDQAESQARSLHAGPDLALTKTLCFSSSFNHKIYYDPTTPNQMLAATPLLSVRFAAGSGSSEGSQGLGGVTHITFLWLLDGDKLLCL